jgi:hypothetical protein
VDIEIRTRPERSDVCLLTQWRSGVPRRLGNHCREVVNAMDLIPGEERLAKRAEIEPFVGLQRGIVLLAAIVEIEAGEVGVRLHKAPIIYDEGLPAGSPSPCCRSSRGG